MYKRQKEYLSFHATDFSGALVLLDKNGTEDDKVLAARMAARYSKGCLLYTSCRGKEENDIFLLQDDVYLSKEEEAIGVNGDMIATNQMEIVNSDSIITCLLYTSLAIGNPLSKELSSTLTKGIISALNRSVETESGVSSNLIQTDTAINSGNSGGPLINTKGEVIGINTLKASDGAEGIGFAIPINDVKDKIDSLSKPILNLGVSIRVVDEPLAKQLNLEEGLYVVEVNEYSPAEKAGLKLSLIHISTWNY